MSIEKSAKQVEGALKEKLGEQLWAVGWYDRELDQRTGVAYFHDDLKQHIAEKKSPRNVLDKALLERLGPMTHELMEHEEMEATVEFYESFIDVHIHIGEFTGLVVAVQRGGEEYRIFNVVDLVEKTIDQEAGIAAD